jgi:hypothetical protein
VPRFFGLQPEDKVPLILEPTFLLMYYGGFTYREAFNLPVPYKRWFIERIVKELNKGRGEDDDPQPIAPSRALHENSPEMRAMQNLTRTSSPSRLRRF